jgi:hypothetical protein
MKLRMIFACAALAATGAMADPGGTRCTGGAQADGMRARVNKMNEQMDRAEWTEDRAKQRELMDLHTKHMREGLRELRKRDMPADCRIELMSEMMESMMRHHQLQEDAK